MRSRCCLTSRLFLFHNARLLCFSPRTVLNHHALEASLVDWLNKVLWHVKLHSFELKTLALWSEMMNQTRSVLTFWGVLGCLTVMHLCVVGSTVEAVLGRGCPRRDRLIAVSNHGLSAPLTSTSSDDASRDTVLRCIRERSVFGEGRSATCLWKTASATNLVRCLPCSLPLLKHLLQCQTVKGQTTMRMHQMRCRKWYVLVGEKKGKRKRSRLRNNFWVGAFCEEVDVLMLAR